MPRILRVNDADGGPVGAAESLPGVQRILKVSLRVATMLTRSAPTRCPAVTRRGVGVSGSSKLTGRSQSTKILGLAHDADHVAPAAVVQTNSREETRRR